MTLDFHKPCPGCAWFSGCLKKETAPAGEGLYCLDYVGEETVREILEKRPAVNGKSS